MGDNTLDQQDQVLPSNLVYIYDIEWKLLEDKDDDILYIGHHFSQFSDDQMYHNNSKGYSAKRGYCGGCRKDYPEKLMNLALIAEL